MSNEKLEEFLKRGGEIKKIKPIERRERRGDHDSRFKIKETRSHEGLGARVDNYKRRAGGKIPRDVKMFQAFKNKMGVY